MSTSMPGDEESADNDDSPSGTNSLWHDKDSILILLLLYTLQGIPMGLSGSIPLIMKDSGASYSSLSMFSMVSLPFSLKLLWAPIVDSLYISTMGRRKTWLVPVQLLCGIVMLYGSFHINAWIAGDDTPGPDAKTLTIFFAFLYFLMATQDIAVDGWALTMLSRNNVEYTSTCNAIGQVLGYFFANHMFILLSDDIWCRKYLMLDAPLLDLSSFMLFWGAVFIILTLAIWVGKTEIPVEATGEAPDGVLDTYMHVVWIFRLKPVQYLCLVLLTVKIAFAACDAVAMFKFQEYGMPKSDIASISPVLLAVSLLLPAVTGKYVAQQPMTVFLGGVILKIVTSILVWCVFQLSIIEYGADMPHGPSTSFFVVTVVVMSLNELAGNLIFGAMMAFFARVSDPSIGGTYMTLLNTISNLGSKWPNILSLWILPHITYSKCVSPLSADISWSDSNSDCHYNADICNENGGSCEIQFDGYTSLQIFCCVFGILWVALLGRSICKLELTSDSDWLTTSVNQKQVN
jgi:MFS transporter, PAT family, solute carrier family 33 (acetyl-CoA transportor), member 1